jgi:hypothetical protein
MALTYLSRSVVQSTPTTSFNLATLPQRLLIALIHCRPQPERQLQLAEES